MTGYNDAMDALIAGLETMKERVAGQAGSDLATLGPLGPDNDLLGPVITAISDAIVEALRLLNDGVTAAQPILIQLDGSAAMLQTAGIAVDALSEGLTGTIDQLFAALGAEGARTAIRRINDAIGGFGEGIEDVGDILSSVGDPGRFITVAHLCTQLVGTEAEPAGTFSDIATELNP